MGLVKRGKKLLAMHGRGDEAEDGAGEADKEKDDHRVMHASVVKVEAVDMVSQRVRVQETAWR